MSTLTTEQFAQIIIDELWFLVPIVVLGTALAIKDLWRLLK
jgi:hypothetical protein